MFTSKFRYQNGKILNFFGEEGKTLKEAKESELKLVDKEDRMYLIVQTTTCFMFEIRNTNNSNIRFIKGLVFIHRLFTMRNLCRFNEEFIASKEGKILRSVIKMECMKSINSGEHIQVIKTFWRNKRRRNA